MTEVVTLGRQPIPVTLSPSNRLPDVGDPEAIAQEKANMDKIQTASFVVGTLACNARCQFCVASMTTEQGISRKRPEIAAGRFATFMEYAQAGAAETAMLTGKGEPTLFPEHISDYLERIQRHEDRLGFSFATKELQTNALNIADKPAVLDPFLRRWKELGLMTAAVSIVHYDPNENRKEYTPHRGSYIDLPATIGRMKDVGLRVRLACTLLDGYIDSAEKLRELTDFARSNEVDQLTIRPVNKPDQSRDDKVSAFIAERYLKPEQHAGMAAYLDANGTVENRLNYGATIYDVDGQNICLTNCLTPVQAGHHRQLIFYPEGTIMTDWQNARQLP